MSGEASGSPGVMVSMVNENGDDRTTAVLGNRIRQARKDAGLSQVRLAQLLNTTQSAISLYEAGQRAVGIDMLLNVARILNRPLHYFLSAIDVVLYVRDSRIANLANELEKRPQDIEELLEYWEFVQWRNVREREQAMELVGGS
jgi:transcriptional regulator with XRE-family HTH domain